MSTTKEIDQYEFQKALQIFINTTILCEKCKNPETEIIENKKKTTLKCNSCGSTYNYP